MIQTFRPHGKFSNRVEGQFLYTDIVGPWNRELVETWSLDAFPLISHFSAEHPYVGITTIYNSMLCPADAMDMLAQVARFSVDKLHCLGNAIVANAQVDGRNLVEMAYARIGLLHFYYDIAPARAWAESLLAAHAAAR